MPMFDFKCNKCGFKDEFQDGVNVPPSLKVPEKCPKCNEGLLEKQFSPGGQSFDIIGSCYMNDYGKHAWKKNMNTVEKAAVLAGNKNPY